MTTTNETLLALIKERGLEAQLVEEKQLENEHDRAVLLAEVATLQQKQAAAVDAVAARRPGIEAAVAHARRALAEAEADLNSLQSEDRDASLLGGAIERRLGKVRVLADRRIDATINALRDLGERARREFKVVTVSDGKDFDGRPVRGEAGNGDQVAAVRNTVAESVAVLEQLQLAPRPDNLQEILDGHLQRAKDTFRQLAPLVEA